jgi:predicted PolB exonuclease-like 3'-5' exonuclease
VLHYRGLVNAVVAARYWDLGDDDREFKFNNYISRYHSRHIDLMDLIALYQPRNNAPLDDVARLMGLPGKLGMDGSQVWGAYREGRIAEIRNYCETDVVNTWLVFLRFKLMRGAITPDQHAREIALVRATLARLDQPHWNEYLAAWPAS